MKQGEKALWGPVDKEYKLEGIKLGTISGINAMRDVVKEVEECDVRLYEGIDACADKLIEKVKKGT